MAKEKFYAVAVGKKPGIYRTWVECNAQVSGFPGNKFQSFDTFNEASAYISNFLEEQKSEKKNKRKVRVINPSDYKIEYLNETQLSAFNFMCTGQNVFVTGDAGTGKSFLINTFIAHQRNQKKNVIVCAPTGVAAININGATIHKTFKIKVTESIIAPDKKPTKIDKVFKKVDTVIIDEISMCRFDLFAYVVNYIKAAQVKYQKKIQLIVIGDFSQLPPVITNADKYLLQALWREILPEIGNGFAFLAPQWNEMDFKTFYLKEVVRQDDGVFIDALTKIKNGDKSQVRYFNETAKRFYSNTDVNAIHLCGTNASAKRINDTKLSQLKAISKTYDGILQGDFSLSECVVDTTIELKVGARVMSLINNSEDLFQNGSLGTVMHLDDDFVTVKFDNGNVCDIEFSTWNSYRYELNENLEVVQYVTGSFTQLPLKIAYAITIHKSQGQTYDSVIIDPNCFAHGQLYVALSRVKKIENMYITKYIPQTSLIIDPKVLQFYKTIETA